MAANPYFTFPLCAFCCVILLYILYFPIQRAFSVREETETKKRLQNITSHLQTYCFDQFSPFLLAPEINFNHLWAVVSLSVLFYFLYFDFFIFWISGHLGQRLSQHCSSLSTHPDVLHLL